MIGMQVRKLAAYWGLRATVCRTIIGAGILVAGCSGAVLAAKTECKTPPSLQAKMDDHPNAAAYTELGAWFGQQTSMTVQMRLFVQR